MPPLLPAPWPGVGIDLLHLPRLVTLLNRRPTYLRRFAARILTPRELATFDARSLGRADVVRWLGVRWAAKEAAFKAGCGGRGKRLLASFQEVEMRKLDNGKPYLHLPRVGGVAELSISHDGEYVVAMALIPTELRRLAEERMVGE